MSFLESTLEFGALRGEPVADLLEEVRRLAERSNDENVLATIASGEAFAAFGSGRFDEARAAWRRVAELSTEYRAFALVRAARLSVSIGDAAAANDELVHLEAAGLHGPAVDAGKLTIRAGIEALDGRPDNALRLYRDAIRQWHDLGLVWDEALCGIDMAMLLDPSTPDVQVAAEAARDILLRLEATPFVAQLEAAMARRPAEAAGATPTRTD